MVVTPKQASEREFDICIVGTGPLGLTLALELERLAPQKSVLLIEAGGLDKEWVPNDLDDTVEIKNPAAHHPPYECTNKIFGGSSLTWGGRCVSYDEIDYIPRPILGENCTWDETVRQEVEPFYEPAADIMECGKAIFQLGSSSPRISENFVQGAVIDTPIERWSLPTRFKDLYRQRVVNSQSLSVLCDTVAVSIGADGQSATLHNRVSGDRIGVRATKIVVAAGAQESTRLLLNSKELFGDNLPASLGRFYQSHISGKIASIRFTGNPKKTDYGFTIEQDGSYVRRRMQLSTEILRDNNLLNTAFWLDNGLYHDPSHRNGTMSFIYLAMITPVIGKKLAPAAIANSVTHGQKARVGAHIWNVILGFPRSFYEPAKIMLGRYFGRRRLPGVFLYSKTNEYALHYHGEQLPHPDNRMTLDGSKMVIDFRFNEEDADSIVRSHEILDKHLRDTGAGELRYWFPRDELRERVLGSARDGIHQNGTTRMSLRPEDGVVDRNLRLWANDNVYICSTSDFPTSGQANPTFLGCAFAARLADHLAKI